MAVKLDMSKAYDRVEWEFIKQVMRKMGFAIRWIDLIMKSVTTASYAVIINGNRGCPFQPTMGLRQGDPLSPFLFLIYSEGLSALMRLAKLKGLVKGAKASRKGPEISHLLFSDDCILFGEATEKGATILKEIQKEYEGPNYKRPKRPKRFNIFRRLGFLKTLAPQLLLASGLHQSLSTTSAVHLLHLPLLPIT
ncbi:reverse transcriptase [Gossypium australe]|uniref:Reverse transcriptase n=1 Tax=Gossypium australe TaxID=47621 RepID=A0A5B6WCD2_9ROSI|nr:reverse transcriptase [Gossypium australe]